MPNAASELAGTRTAIVTRPAGQSQQWLHALQRCGQAAVALPLLAIQAVPDQTALLGAWRRLVAAGPAPEPGFDVVMFVSANAVEQFFATGRKDEGRKGEVGELAGWPANTLAAATGPGTVAALALVGVPACNIVAPPNEAAQFDSEALWPLLLQRLSNRGPGPLGPDHHLLLVRGQEGRNWLQAQWQALGGQVSTVVAYHRVAPQWNAQQRALAHQALVQPHRFVWVLSSSEALQQLQALSEAICKGLHSGQLGAVMQGECSPASEAGLAWRGSLAVATHPRIAQAAQALGFAHVQVCLPVAERVAAVVANGRLWPTVGNSAAA